MFSQVSVNRVGVGISGHMSCLGVGVPCPMFHPGEWVLTPRQRTCQDEYSGGIHPPPQTWDLSLDTHPPLLTPSGGHQNMYGWHAGGTHPTGMLSCTSFL